MNEKLSNIVDDLLFLSEEDSESLERALTFEDTLRTLSWKLIKLAHVHENSTTPEVASASYDQRANGSTHHYTTMRDLP